MLEVNGGSNMTTFETFQTYMIHTTVAVAFGALLVAAFTHFQQFGA